MRSIIVKGRNLASVWPKRQPGPFARGRAPADDLAPAPAPGLSPALSPLPVPAVAPLDIEAISWRTPLPDHRGYCGAPGRTEPSTIAQPLLPNHRSFSRV